MAELFLAIVACDAEIGDMELHCAVALGSGYRRSRVPMPFEECLRAWQVPHIFSVCTIAILFGETGLGNISVPIMRLGRCKDSTLDEWFPVEPSSTVRLRLLLHLRSESGGAAPASFERLCSELLGKAGKPSPQTGQAEGAIHHAEPKVTRSDLGHSNPKPASPTSPASPASPASPTATSPERAKDLARKEDKVPNLQEREPDFAASLQELHRLCQSMLPSETPPPPRGPLPVDDEASPSKDNVYDEARAQLLSQKEALERESTELNTHWAALQEDQATKHEVLAEMRVERLSIFATVEELQTEVEDATTELKEAQAVASSRLATRRRLQAELLACSADFGDEAAEQRRASEALRRKRALLRSEAVELGRELQCCVSRGDALVSENLQLRTESAAVEEAEDGRFQFPRCNENGLQSIQGCEIGKKDGNCG
ncbi:unnamed protein product [Effrenium voratum]|uniref:Uncharacterized protein n=1 Tax=Effrenium voratum TaxID=2562239 RepID=A0AA36IZ62_9DINO|nr:unnamed protein product [Effrenium voratum]CAJ1461799.1 unnamed protein product [Effrenium voratum]